MTTRPDEPRRFCTCGVVYGNLLPSSSIFGHILSSLQYCKFANSVTLSSNSLSSSSSSSSSQVEEVTVTADQIWQTSLTMEAVRAMSVGAGFLSDTTTAGGGGGGLRYVRGRFERVVGSADSEA